MDICYITTVTMTLAMKGKRLLGANGIAVTVSRLPPKLTTSGCAWGLSLDCRQAMRAKRILDSADFSYGKILRADGSRVVPTEKIGKNTPPVGITGKPDTHTLGGSGRT